MIKQLPEFFKYINAKSPVDLRTFWISFVTVALVVILSKLGVKPPEFFHLPTSVNLQMISPQQEKSDVLELIKPKLEQKTNAFYLKKPTSFIPVTNAGNEYENATAYGVIDYDTGEVLLQKNFDTKTHVASLTKIMTAVVALDLASSAEEFEVSQKAAEIIPTKIGVSVGEKLAVEKLLNALLLTSANDAAEVIKEGINKKYGEDVFIQAMNEKAKTLKLFDSRFDNPQGFDSIRNFSSVADLAVLSHYALENYSIIAEIAKKDYQFYSPNNNHKQIDLYNWNGLIGVYPGAFGLKIGNTGWAKYTTVVSAQREGKKVLVVLLGAPGVLERDLWSARLLDLGFEKLAGLLPANIGEDELMQKYSSWKYWN